MCDLSRNCVAGAGGGVAAGLLLAHLLLHLLALRTVIRHLNIGALYVSLRILKLSPLFVLSL